MDQVRLSPGNSTLKDIWAFIYSEIVEKWTQTKNMMKNKENEYVAILG